MEITLTMTSPSSSSLRIRASWDTQQRLPYNPNAPKRPPKPAPPTTTTLQPSTSDDKPLSTTSTLVFSPQYVSNLLKRASPSRGIGLDDEELYMGYERWLPTPPKVEKPRSVYNAATLAYIGDSIYELYARRHFLFPPLSMDECNERVMAIVRCEAQDALLQKLLREKFLTDEERKILRWGKNVGSANTRTKKRAGSAVYNRASSLETLIGYLYLTNITRLDELMKKLGFSTGASSEMITEESNSGQAG